MADLDSGGAVRYPAPRQNLLDNVSILHFVLFVKSMSAGVRTLPDPDQAQVHPADGEVPKLLT